jgi:predicted Fe-S protein YdhL (DUF1289 family)
MVDVWNDPVPDPVDPCTRRCGVSSVTGWCRGCYRTLTEIADWERLTKDEQLEVLDKAKQRENQSRK